MRNIILNASKQLGKTTRLWRGFPIVYILVIFFAVPTLLLGLSSLFEQNTKGYTTLGSVLTILLVAGLVYFIYWYHFKQGKAKMTQCFRDRERRRKVNESLPDIMDKMAKVDSLEAKVAALTDHTGLPEGEGEGEEEDVEANANAAKKNTVHQENTSTSTDDGDSNEIPMS